jgi:CRISPR type I-D-associated protein Csc2
VSIEKIKESLRDGLVERPEALIGAKTIQLVLFRQALDFTVLRTEESREINHATTPRSASDGQSMRRVAFLGSKQKAAESRRLQALLSSANEAAGRSAIECYLKDNLCGRCPRCGLFGAVSTVAGSNEPNLKHRIEYGTAYSLRPYEDVCEALTFNAVDEKTQKTGQAFQSRPVVVPLTLFPSIVTLRSVTATEVALALKTILATTSYGAESRTGGDMRNLLAGLVVGWEEIVTPLELALELSSGAEATVAAVKGVLDQYKERAALKAKVRVLTEGELDDLGQAVQDVELDKSFLDSAYGDVDHLRAQQRGSSGPGAASKSRRTRAKKTEGTPPRGGDAPGGASS